MVWIVPVLCRSCGVLNGVILSRDADQQIAQAKQLDVLCVEDIPAGSLVAFGQKNEAGVNVVRHIGIARKMVTLSIHWGTCAFIAVSEFADLQRVLCERLLGAYTIDLNLPRCS